MRAWQRVSALITAATAVISLASSASSAMIDDKLAACLACHGATGQSTIPDVPSLGGQPVFYLTVQLLMFREKLRVIEPMNLMLHGVSDDELRSMAEQLATLPPPQPADGAVDANRVGQARAIVEQNRCNFCHQRSFSGEHNVPRLAAQREDYLVKALRDYKNNNRRGYDASMADVLYSIAEDEILDLAYFLARLR